MSNASPFWTSTLQDLSIDIKSATNHGVLTPQNALWSFGSPFGTSTLTNSQHGSSLGSVRVHSLTLFALLVACDMTPGSTYRSATLQPPYLGREPRLGLRHLWWRKLMTKETHDKGILEKLREKERVRLFIPCQHWNPKYLIAYSRLRPYINPKTAHGHARNWPSCMRPCTGMTVLEIKKCFSNCNRSTELTIAFSKSIQGHDH